MDESFLNLPASTTNREELSLDKGMDIPNRLFTVTFVLLPNCKVYLCLNCNTMG